MTAQDSMQKVDSTNDSNLTLNKRRPEIWARGFVFNKSKGRQFHPYTMIGFQFDNSKYLE